jgi:hypothetical protein
MPEKLKLQVKRGSSVAADEAQAVAELRAQIGMDHAAVTLFFCSAAYDRARLAAALRELFPEPLIGCTTAGQLGPMGYTARGITGVSMTGDIAAHPHVLDLADWKSEVAALAAEVAACKCEDETHCGFGFLLVDGLSQLEERLVSDLYQSLPSVPIAGGSAGDDMNLAATYVFAGGEFRAASAVFTLFQTRLPFSVFKFEHFHPDGQSLVITESDPERRIVREINGELAAPVYARAAGTTVAQLNPEVFSHHPFVLELGGEVFVRSIRQVNPDGSLTLSCAIEDGIVLSLGRAVDPVRAAREAFEKVHARIGKPAVVLGCDCVLRKLELQSAGLLDAMSRVMVDRNVVGFSTYGEQFNGIHINQTFTGVAIGGPA